jgi:hypothetical protein
VGSFAVLFFHPRKQSTMPDSAFRVRSGTADELSSLSTVPLRLCF